MWFVFRTSLRALARSPGFTGLGVLVLASGIGAAVTLFSVVDATFLRPLPYSEAEQLVWLRETHAEVPARRLSYPTFLDWRDRSSAFSSMAAIRGMELRWSNSDSARLIDVDMVSGSFFSVLDVAPALGRSFVESDDVFGAAPVAVVSYDFWQTALGARSDILGERIVLDETSYAIVGVAPQQLALPRDPSAWITFGPQNASDSPLADRSIRWLFGLARVDRDFTIEQARADLEGVQAQLASEYPQSVAGHEVEVLPLRDVLVGNTRVPLLLSIAAVGLLLMIVCVNVSNLLLVRVNGRRRELAVRASLGARSQTLYFQQLAEGILLVAFGSIFGLVLAAFGTRLLSNLLAGELFVGATMDMSAPMYAFTFLLAIVIASATTAIPAWRSTRLALHQSGSDRSASSQGVTLDALLVLQTALAVILLVGAVLLGSSMQRIASSDPGFNKSGVLTMELSLPTDYQPGDQLNSAYGEIVRAITAVPGVSSAAIYNDLPGFEAGWQTDIRPQVPEERLNLSPGEQINVDWRIVSNGYFETMGITILNGRSFSETEAGQRAPVMLIDERLAQRFWGGTQAVGGHIRYDSPDDIEVIGVAANTALYGSEEERRITIYTPYGRFPFMRRIGAAVRTDLSDPASVTESVRAAIRQIDPAIAMTAVVSFDERLENQLSARTLITQVMVLFAAFSLSLAAVGIYSVVSYIVSRRKREYGVRLALGATYRNMVSLVMSRTVMICLVGITTGLLIAGIGSRLLEGFLFNTHTLSPSVYASVFVFSLVVAAGACLTPALRASRIDPVESLRAG
jgi:putative ABC transport system permease protein